MHEHDMKKGMDGVKEKLSTAFIRLTKDREALIATVKKLDTNCAYCKHNMVTAPCGETDSAMDCGSCNLDCYCKDCDENSKWEWIGEEEVNG